MRYALWFAVPVFLVSGALFNAVAHNAEGVLGLAFMSALAAGAYGWYLQNQLEQAFDNPAPKTYAVSKVVACHRVKDVLLTHSVPSLSSSSSLPDSAHWSFTQLDPESGVLTAVLTFSEKMCPIAGGPGALSPQPRRIVLQALFSATSPSSTSVEFHWQVCSPLNRDTVNTLITALSTQFHRSLSQSPILVP